MGEALPAAHGEADAGLRGVRGAADGHRNRAGPAGAIPPRAGAPAPDARAGRIAERPDRITPGTRMSEPIKLKAEGDRHTMDVASCKKLDFGDYPEYEFTGKDGSVVRVPESSTHRQLDRLTLTSQTVVGQRITFKRDKNAKIPSKPFWGIYLEEGGAGNGTGG